MKSFKFEINLKAVDSLTGHTALRVPLGENLLEPDYRLFIRKPAPISLQGIAIGGIWVQNSNVS